MEELPSHDILSKSPFFLAGELQSHIFIHLIIVTTSNEYMFIFEFITSINEYCCVQIAQTIARGCSSIKVTLSKSRVLHPQGYYTKDYSISPILI